MSVNLRSRHEDILANLNLLRCTHLREPHYEMQSLVSGTELSESLDSNPNVSPGQTASAPESLSSSFDTRALLKERTLECRNAGRPEY